MQPQGYYSYLTANLPFYILLLLSASIPFPFNTDKVALIILVVLAVLEVIKYKSCPDFRLTNVFTLIPPVAFFFVLLIGLAYSSDLNLGWRKIETSLPILAVSLIAYTFSKSVVTDRKIEALLITFVVSNLISIVYCFAALTLNTDLEITASTSFNIYTRDNLANQLTIHPIYIALTTAASMQVLFYFLIQRKHSLPAKLFWITCQLISFLFIILLGAKMALIAVVGTTLFWISVYIIKNRKVVVGIILTLLLILSVMGSIVYIPNINKRFTEIQNTPLTPPRGLAHNSTNLRIGQLFCSLEIIKANWMIGVGTGDYEKALNYCYETRAYSEVLYRDSYNAHNQYLQTWIMVGLVGVIILILLLFAPVYYSLINKDWLTLSVFLTFIICFVTESYLQSSKGVVLFSFFYIIFLFRNTYNSRYQTVTNKQ